MKSIAAKLQPAGTLWNLGSCLEIENSRVWGNRVGYTCSIVELEFLCWEDGVSCHWISIL